MSDDKAISRMDTPSNMEGNIVQYDNESNYGSVRGQKQPQVAKGAFKLQLNLDTS